MKKFSYVICTLIFFASCGGTDNRVKTCFADDVVQIDSFQRTIQLKGEMIIPEAVAGMQGPICVDDYIVFYVSERGYDNIFYVYNKDGKYISQFGTKGRANNEMINVWSHGQKEGRCIWIDDNVNRKFHLIDIKASVKNNILVFDKTINIRDRYKMPFYTSMVILKDGRLAIKESLYTTGNAGDFSYVIYDPISDTLNSQTLYKDVKAKFFTQIYAGDWQYISDKGIIAEAMMSFNQLNFMDADGGNRRSVVVGEATPIEGDIGSDNSNNRTYYIDLVATSDKLYALYINQPYSDAYNLAKPSNIHVFSLDGEPLYQLEVPEYIEYIDVDEENEYLYAMTIDYGQLIRYPLVE